MFNLTRTFKNDVFEISPILMGDTVIFLPSELNDQLGYADLAHSVCNSKGAIEGTDYVIITGDNLRQLKELIHGRSTTASVKIAQNVSSLIVLTESGLWWTMFNSTKPDCIKLRTWVTSEVLPTIRKTGSYSLAVNPAIAQAEALLEMTKRWVAVEDEQKRQAQAQLRLEQDVKEVKAKQDAITNQSGYFSILAWLNLNKLAMPASMCSAFGKKATKLSKKANLPVGTVADQRYGMVNIYYKSILEQVIPTV